MKAGAILPHVGVYGGVRRFIEIGNEFSRLGHHFTLYTPRGDRPAWLPFYGGTAPIEALGVAPQADVLMCGDTGMLEVFARAPARLKLMFILGRRYVRKYVRFLDRGFVVVGVSGDWQTYMPGVKGYTVAGGVNLAMFRRSRTRKDGDSTEARLLSFGTPKKKVKGSMTVLRAFRELAARRAATRGLGQRAAFWVTGRPVDSLVSLTLFDREPIVLPRWARRLAVKTVESPSQTELVRLYSDADIFVSCETSAGWCNSVAEAMACGTAVVCGTAGTSDVARDGETALVVPPDDHEAVADAVERLIVDRALRDRLAAAALEHIAAFSWQHVCRSLLNIIEEHLG